MIVSNGGTAQSPGRTLSVVDADSWSVVRTLDLSHGGEVGLMPKDFIIAGGTFYVVCHDSHRVWYGPLAGPMEGYIEVGHYPLGIAALSSGALAVVTCAGDDPWAAGSGRLSVIDLAAKRRIAEIPVGRMPNYGIAVAGGRVAVSALLDDAIQVFDEANGRVVRSIATGRNSLPLGLGDARVNGRLFWGAALFGDGRTDAAAAYDEGWGREVVRERLAGGVDSGGPVCLAASARDMLAVSLFMGNRVRFYQIPSGRLLSTVPVPQPGMGEFSPDGRYYYAPCFTGELCRVDTDDFTARFLPVGPNPVRVRYCAAPAGGFPASANASRSISASPAANSSAGPPAPSSSARRPKTGTFRDFLGMR